MSKEIHQPGSHRDNEIATLGGGCFWCLEAVFDDLKGVEKIESGYSGGPASNPTYHQVCAGTTGHAEAVELEFDPGVVSYEKLLDVFWDAHDPTTLNRQGPDVGSQYRSAIFFHTPEQKTIAEQVIKEISAAEIWKAPIVTEVAPFKAFYVAEDYHQEYFRNNPEQMYCQMVIAPKVEKFQKQFLAKLKK